LHLAYELSEPRDEGWLADLEMHFGNIEREGGLRHGERCAIAVGTVLGSRRADYWRV
jgi:hypothetical protein